MAERHRAQWASFVAAALFILAGLRDLYLPGFLSISGRGHGNGVWTIVAGLVIFGLAWIGWVRRTRSESR
jgi:hypothetical protein